MYTLSFTSMLDEQTVQFFDDSSDAVNAAVYMQAMEGGYNTSGEWHYEIINDKGHTVHEDECMRHFDQEIYFNKNSSLTAAVFLCFCLTTIKTSNARWNSK